MAINMSAELHFLNVPLTDAPIERHLNNVFKRLGYSYLDKERTTNASASSSTSSEPFTVNEEPILEGSRNTKFYRKCALYSEKDMGETPLEDIKIQHSTTT